MNGWVNEWHRYLKPIDGKFRISDFTYTGSKSPFRSLRWVLIHNCTFTCFSKFLYEFLLFFDFHLFFSVKLKRVLSVQQTFIKLLLNAREDITSTVWESPVQQWIQTCETVLLHRADYDHMLWIMEKGHHLNLGCQRGDTCVGCRRHCGQRYQQNLRWEYKLVGLWVAGILLFRTFTWVPRFWSEVSKLQRATRVGLCPWNVLQI